MPEGPPTNPFSPDLRGLFTLSAIWHHDPVKDRCSTCRLITASDRGDPPQPPPPPPRGSRRLKETRRLEDLGSKKNHWRGITVGNIFSPPHKAMPITTSSDTNTFLVLGVQPTAGGEGFVSYTFPSTPPNPSGLLQCDSDGTFRWVTPAGIPLGESRHFTGSMTGVCAGPDTEVRMTRVTGNKSSILVSVPVSDPTGCYVEATVRAYASGIAGVTAVRAQCGLLYSGGSWSVGNTSYLGEYQESLLEMKFAVDTLLGGIGAVYMVIKGQSGLRVDSDIAVYGAPSAT